MSRATLIELVPKLNNTHFYSSTEMVYSHCGSPSLIISDNVKTFTSVYCVLSLSYKLVEVQSCLASKTINWHFTLQKCPLIEIFVNVWLNQSNKI